MAAQTFLAELVRRAPAAFAEGNHGLLGRIVYMLVCCAMAGLAVVFTLPDFCMVGGVETSHRLFMAAGAIGAKRSSLGQIRRKKLTGKTNPYC